MDGNTLSSAEHSIDRCVGITLKQFFTEASEEKLQRYVKRPVTHETDPPRMAGFGVLPDLANENRRVLAAIEEEFETLSS